MKNWLILVGVALAIVGCSEVSQTGNGASKVQAAATQTVSYSSRSAQINAMRTGKGLPKLQRSPKLAQAALAHATEMATKGYFGHKGSNGSTVGKRVTRTGYKWCAVAENIAKGQKSASEAIADWKNSPSHYRNVVNRKMTAYGMARSGNVWVMVLGAKKC